MVEGCDTGSLNYLIIQVARAHRALAAELLEQLGLHPGQEYILLNLYEQDGLNQSQLAERLAVQPPTVTKMLQRMEATGLLERRSSPQDSRVWLVYLSEKGRALMPRIHQAWIELETCTSQGLSVEEKEQLEVLLGKVRTHLVAGGSQCD